MTENMIEFHDLPQEWQGFLQACQSCKNCDLYKTRDNVVVYRGSLNAPLMLIGEGPGAEEDRQGRPFVGRSGRLLDSLLQAQEFTAEDFHICNIVKCRPPENRVPTEIEAQACKRLLSAQFALVKPKVIVLVGATAYKYFTNLNNPISKVRGQWIEKSGYYIMPTFHPAYLLRNQSKRIEMWEDFKEVRKKLEELNLIRPMLKPFEFEIW
ncbi:MAG: uracil-DNA glycosylase [Saccharofermentanales bacterium]|jgi:DNA polymerase|nr:uracil-DNA glycosylase [Bacillota bacterium]